MYYTLNKYYRTKKTADGYDSKFEASYAQELEIRLKAGEILGWEKQKVLDLVVNGYLVCTYKIDFIVYHDGYTEYVECKGVPTDTWKIKWKLFEALYTSPNNKLTIVFQGKTWRPKLRKVKNNLII